jgi:hypothetical protein
VSPFKDRKDARNSRRFPPLGLRVGRGNVDMGHQHRGNFSLMQWFEAVCYGVK